MYHTRSVSAPAWGNEPTTPRSIPPLASPSLARKSALDLAPRPLSPPPTPIFCALAGYTDVPASAESETFALFERQRDSEREKLREFPIADKVWESVGMGGNLAVKRGRGEMRIEKGEEVEGKCAGSCCRAWTVTPDYRTPRPGAVDSPQWPGQEALSNSSSSSTPALLKAIPRPA